MSPHIALDAMQRANQRGNLGCQHGAEQCLTVYKRGRRMAAMHGDGLSLHRRDHKREPKHNNMEREVE